MIYQITWVYRFKYVEYDKENRLAISLIVLSRKICQIRKILEIWDSDMVGIGKTDFSNTLGLQWFIKLEGFVDSIT